jgi:dihydrofolate synthase/folylpolyglutamate synthase
LVKAGSDVIWQGLGFDFNQQRLRVEGRLGSYELSIPLLGQHQLENAATAVAALEVLAGKGFNISKECIIDGLGRVNWPGRLQIVSHHPLVVVDGAHNIDSARRLKQSIEQYFDFDRAILVIGASCDKDIASIVSELFSLFDKVIVTRSRHPRAMAPAPLVAEFARHGVKAQVAEDVPSALSQALALAGDKDLLCVAGSLFVVGEAMEQAARLSLIR